MIHCLISGMKKCVMMPVNYKKVKNAMQEKEKNSALFQGRLIKAFREYTNIDPSTPKGQNLLSLHFISQSTLDIR